MNKLALFFPGQGSQSVGMMAGFGDSAIIQEYIYRSLRYFRCRFLGDGNRA